MIVVVTRLYGCASRYRCRCRCRCHYAWGNMFLSGDDCAWTYADHDCFDAVCPGYRPHFDVDLPAIHHLHHPGTKCSCNRFHRRSGSTWLLGRNPSRFLRRDHCREPYLPCRRRRLACVSHLIRQRVWLLAAKEIRKSLHSHYPQILDHSDRVYLSRFGYVEESGDD